MKRLAITCIVAFSLILMHTGWLFADTLVLTPSAQQTWSTLTITANKSTCKWVSSDSAYLTVSPEQTTGATLDGTSTTTVASTHVAPGKWVWITATCKYANGKTISACIEYDVQCYTPTTCSISRGFSNIGRINGCACYGTNTAYNP